MSVKIYDSTIGAFKDAETPLICDEQAQAWKDSVGLVYDTSKGAWYGKKDGRQLNSYCIYTTKVMNVQMRLAG